MPITPDSLEELIDRYWGVLIAWVGGDRYGVDDVVQAAFIKLAAEDPPPINCVAWLFTVTKRLAINERLSQAKRRSREVHTGSQKVESLRLTDELELQDLLSKLDVHEREIVIAKIWGGLTFDEIGSACGDSKATVWRIYQNGIAKLKAAYSEF